MVAVCVIAIGVAMYIRRNVSVAPVDLAAYMPRRESTLFHINFLALRESGILANLVGSTVAEEPDYKTFVQETGFDYKTDLDSVLGSAYDNTRLFLMVGRFDWKKLMAYATHQGGACHNGFCRVPNANRDRTLSFYAVNNNLMAFASSANDSAAYDIKKRSDKLAGAIPPQPVWISAPAALLNSADQLPAGVRQFAKALSGSERILLTLGPTSGRFELTMDVTCKSAEEAATLRANMEALTEIVRKLIARENQQPNPADLSGVLSAGAFQRIERHVIGKWPIARAFINSLGTT